MEAYVNKFMKNVYNTVEAQPKRHVLRTSALPYCGMIKTLELLTAPTEDIPYSAGYYFGVGTAVHENAQKYAAISKMSDHIIACWKCRCTRKNRRYNPEYPTNDNNSPTKPKIIGPCEKPRSNCPKCKAPYSYEEIEFFYRGLSGHMDLLLRDEDGNYVAIDFKTTSASKVATGQGLPYEANKIQLETYCLLLWLCFKIRVKGYALIYISRDKAGTGEKTNTWMKGGEATHRTYYFPISNARLKLHHSQIKRADKSYEAAAALLKINYASSDAGEVKSLLKQMSNNRACRDEEEYLSYMNKGFYGKARCPFSSGKLCYKAGTPEPIKQIYKLVKNRK